MILKDPNTDVVVRMKERKDFEAALKLIEKLILPTYCHVVFEDDLFNDYSSVKPIVKLVME